MNLFELITEHKWLFIGFPFVFLACMMVFAPVKKDVNPMIFVRILGVAVIVLLFMTMRLITETRDMSWEGDRASREYTNIACGIKKLQDK
jgi:hypothetical protein